MLVQNPSRFYHALPDHEILQSFGSSVETGLTSEDVARRYEQYGWNELQFKPGKPAWLRFLLQFHQPLLYILLLAGIVKAFLGSWTNAAVIWGVTLINAIIGYVQEAQAEGAIASLAKAVTTETTVLREGQPLRIPSRDLVPGDLVLLASGDKVPADLRLLRVRNMQVDESALTGESVPVEKSIQVLPADTTPRRTPQHGVCREFCHLWTGAGYCGGDCQCHGSGTNFPVDGRSSQFEYASDPQV